MPPPTSLGPIRETQINQTLFVGEVAVRTIQAAVDYAVADGGSFLVVIPVGYAGADTIAAVVNGAANVFISDQRRAAAQAYNWSGTQYIPSQFIQAAPILCAGTSSTFPPANIGLTFDPTGTSGAGSGDIRVDAVDGEGMPGLNIQLNPGTPGGLHTFMRMDADPATGLPRIQMPQELIVNGPFTLGPNGGPQISSDGGEVNINAAPNDGIHLNVNSGGYVDFGDGEGNRVARINQDGEADFEGGVSTAATITAAGDVTSEGGQITASTGMVRGQEIVFPVLTPLDGMKVAGTYWCQAWGGRPLDSLSYQFLEVMTYSWGTAIIQRLTPAVTGNASLGDFYMRFYSDFTNTWSQWFIYKPTGTVAPTPLEDDPLAQGEEVMPRE
jgi:hypothetical protein